MLPKDHPPFVQTNTKAPYRIRETNSINKGNILIIDIGRKNIFKEDTSWFSEHVLVEILISLEKGRWSLGMHASIVFKNEQLNSDFQTFAEQNKNEDVLET